MIGCQIVQQNMDYTQLVRDALKLKPDAQRQLYDHFAPSMLGVCFRYTKSMRDAEDTLQEGFIKVFRYLHQYKAQGELGAWIRKIMVNTVLTYLKKNRNYLYDLSFDDTSLHPVSTDDPEVRLDTKELAGLIRQLPSGYQTIFNLHAVEGYTHVEIGEMLGISDGTSRSQYARARSLLIEWLDKFSSEVKPGNYAGK